MSGTFKSPNWLASWDLAMNDSFKTWKEDVGLLGDFGPVVVMIAQCKIT